MADNKLTIKQKSTLPVSKTRQDKSLFHSLSDTYLPPAPVSERTISSIGLPPHLLCSHLALTDFRHTCATTIATSFRLRPPPVLHDDLRYCHCRVRPRR